MENSRTTHLGPFGELIRATGPTAKVNPFMFSTKFYDWESGLYYYGFRYYNPSTGRWLSRDPAEEDQGGPNLYGFVGNDGINQADEAGLWKIVRNPKEKWATAMAEDGDSVLSLALLIHLDVSQANLWLKGWNGGTINVCNKFQIPNTVGVYTSKPSVGDGFATYATHLRNRALNYGSAYMRKGYFVAQYVNADSEGLFASLWNTDGIYAMIFAGHGNSSGFLASPSHGDPSGYVGPGQNVIGDPGEDKAAPPYRLQAVLALNCSSAAAWWITAGQTHHWFDYVASGGSFIGFPTAAYWTDSFSEIDINENRIPP